MINYFKIYIQVCDKIKNPTLITLLGHLIASVAYILIGPAPFLDGFVSNSVNLSFCVAVMIGMSWSLVGVSSFTRVSRAALRLGYCDDMNTNLNLSGKFGHLDCKIDIAIVVNLLALWLSSFYLGSFLGPTISGFVVEAIGFRSTAVTYMVVSLIMFLTNLAELVSMEKATKHNKLDYRLLEVEDVISQ